LFLKHGDLVTCAIDGLGKIEQPIVNEVKRTIID
jgi:2-keto-4-pentenoate hydratase/2-oxohepta-3-ene-1,7-dioic acid hydratase in catechol pathway